MDASIDAFIAEPSPETLAAARDAWLTARDDYGPTEAFRFYGGPIDNEENGVEGLINAWPLDEAYIDYVDGSPDAGVINLPDE
jgi:putative iron-regulated protein